MTRLQRILYLLLVWSVLGADIRASAAPHYSPGLMARVSRVRKLEQVPCMVSSARYPIGTWLYVIGLNTETVERCRVTDVSAPRDRERHLRTNRELELSYESAQRLCGRQALRDRPERCPVITVVLEVHP